MVGAVIMVHGDDHGLILPPKLAPYQVVLVPIWHDEGEKAQVLATVETITGKFGEAVRYTVDDREEYSPGWKFNDWEMRGVPLRIEVGPKDVAQGQVTLARRDVTGREGKSAVPMEGLVGKVKEMLDTIQADLFAKALKFREDNTSEPKDYEEFKIAVENGFAWGYWCGSAECEAIIKDETKATIRCIPFDQDGAKGSCVHCGHEATEKVIFARAY